MFEDKRIQELSWVLGLGLILLVTALTLSSLWDVFGKWGIVAPTGAQAQTASLSGQGSVFAVPDTARFTFSVVSRGATADVVQENNSERVEKVSAYLKGLGVADEEIKTINYNLYPQYRYSELEGQVLTGYELRETLQVRSENLKEIGVLVSGAVQNGANEVSGVELFIDDPDAVREEARAEAISKIEQKKKEMERALGVRFGRVVGVSESDGGGGPLPYFAEEFGRGGAVDSVAVSAPTIEAGSQEVFVTVTITYQLR